MKRQSTRYACRRCGLERVSTSRAMTSPFCVSCKTTRADPVDHWTEAAACAGLDTDMFYALEESRQRLAKAVCASCPVLALCLAHALNNNEEGIWGGTTENERRVMQGKRPRSWERGQRSTRVVANA